MFVPDQLVASAPAEAVLGEELFRAQPVVLRIARSTSSRLTLSHCTISPPPFVISLGLEQGSHSPERTGPAQLPGSLPVPNVRGRSVVAVDPRPDGVTLPASYLPIAAQAMDLASEIIRSQRPTVVTTKSDRDMVSDIDVQIERTVRGFLHERSPEVGFVGEEEGNSPSESRLQWVLDPVDGTANYVKGIPLYAISLALIDQNEPVLGVIDVPAERCRYSAAAGRGAYCGETRIQVRPTARLRDAIVAVGDYAVGPGASAKNELRLTVVGQLAERAERIRMLGSAAIDLAWVAHGRTDAALMFSNKPWDTAAGLILVREAGGLVVDVDGARHTMRSQSTVAVPAELLGEMLSLIPAPT
jgi:myo-inositol-1(or 4)-monophosphatase